MATAGGTPAAAGDNLKRLTDLYRMMVRIRTFEETALEAYKAGEIPGPLHVSFGQEAIPAGICASLRHDDRLTSNHRGHGHALAKGADAAPIPQAPISASSAARRGITASGHVGGVGQECEVARALHRERNRALLARGVAGDPARQDLARLGI